MILINEHIELTSKIMFNNQSILIESKRKKQVWSNILRREKIFLDCKTRFGINKAGDFLHNQPT